MLIALKIALTGNNTTRSCSVSLLRTCKHDAPVLNGAVLTVVSILLVLAAEEVIGKAMVLVILFLVVGVCAEVVVSFEVDVGCVSDVV